MFFYIKNNANKSIKKQSFAPIILILNILSQLDALLRSCFLYLIY